MRVVGFTGRARSGKDTAAQYLIDNYGFVKVAFADPIREMGACIVPTAYTANTDTLKETCIPWIGKSRREIEQILGTEFGRNMIAHDLWIRVASKRIQKLAEGDNGKEARIVVTDVRFDNEAQFLRDSYRATIVEVIRPGIEPIKTHISEAGISCSLIDISLLNTADIDRLHQRIDIELKRYC